MFHKCVTNSTYSFIIEKVKKRLSGWNAKLLSFADRVTLAKPVLFTIPRYFMQLAFIPKGVCLEIEKLIRKFVWGVTGNEQKISLVGWNKYCMPIDKGALGLGICIAKTKLS